MTREWLAPTIPAAISAAAALWLVFHQRRQDRAVGWSLKQSDAGAGYVLVRDGGGIARDVDIAFDDAAAALSSGELHHDVVHPNAEIRVGTFMPPSDSVNPGKVTVTWRGSRWGLRKSWHSFVT